MGSNCSCTKAANVEHSSGRASGQGATQLAAEGKAVMYMMMQARMDAQRVANGTAGRLDEGPASIEVDIAGELLAGQDRHSYDGLPP